MRRALVLFGNEIERGSLAESAAFLEKELGFKIYPLYVKDIAREKLMSATDGLMLAGRAPFISHGWEEIEQAEIQGIKEVLKEKNIDAELCVDIGDVAEVVTEHMKRCDLLVMGKNDILTEKEINILKNLISVLVMISICLLSPVRIPVVKQYP